MGFKTEGDRNKFYSDLHKGYDLLKTRYGDRYIVEYCEKDDL